MACCISPRHSFTSVPSIVLLEHERMCPKQVCGSVILNALVSVLSFVQTHRKIIQVRVTEELGLAGMPGEHLV